MKKGKNRGKVLPFSKDRKKQNQGGVTKINLKEKFNQLYKKKG
jgi:hypothetical protein